VSKLEEETLRRELSLAAVCDAANGDAPLTGLEADFQALEDTVLEPFDKNAWYFTGTT
jgi:hypothetical protein